MKTIEIPELALVALVGRFRLGQIHARSTAFSPHRSALIGLLPRARQ